MLCCFYICKYFLVNEPDKFNVEVLSVISWVILVPRVQTGTKQIPSGLDCACDMGRQSF